jgi:hypothetical protein
MRVFIAAIKVCGLRPGDVLLAFPSPGGEFWDTIPLKAIEDYPGDARVRFLTTVTEWGDSLDDMAHAHELLEVTDTPLWTGWDRVNAALEANAMRAAG